MTATPLLSIVLPSYNNGTCLPATIRRIRQTCPKETEIIAVIDGSTDETLHILSPLLSRDPYLRVIAHATRRGKGSAVREGVRGACGRFIAFIDADMAIDPSYVAQGLTWLQQDATLDAVIARRTIYHTNAVRHVAHTLFHWMAFLLFRMPYHDTQAPMKIFRAPVAKGAFGNMQTRSYAFDIEVLFRTMARGGIVGEIPVYQRKTQSSIRWNLLLFTMMELLRMYHTYVAHCVINMLRRKTHRRSPIDLFSLRHLIIWPLSWPALWMARFFLRLQNIPVQMRRPQLPDIQMKGPMVVRRNRVA